MARGKGNTDAGGMKIRTLKDVEAGFLDGPKLARIIANQLPRDCPLRPNEGRFKGGRGPLAVALAQNLQSYNRAGENPPTCQACPNRDCREGIRRASFIPPTEQGPEEVW